MYTLVLIRHGQTVYNKEKIFCGWTDVELTEKGIEEARMAGKNLKNAGYSFDIAFSSVLKRVKNTLDIVLSEMNLKDIPIKHSWKLNERHYGDLQGKKHEDIARECTPEQVQKWRRSFSDRPPQLAIDDPRHPCNDTMYCDIETSELPCGESLEDTIKRVLPYWHSEIVPQIKEGKKVIVAASGNSLRSLVKHLDNIDDNNIVGMEIQNGVPLVYKLDEEMKAIERYYLTESGTKPF